MAVRAKRRIETDVEWRSRNENVSDAGRASDLQDLRIVLELRRRNALFDEFRVGPDGYLTSLTSRDFLHEKFEQLMESLEGR